MPRLGEASTVRLGGLTKVRTFPGPERTAGPAGVAVHVAQGALHLAAGATHDLVDVPRQRGTTDTLYTYDATGRLETVTDPTDQRRGGGHPDVAAAGRHDGRELVLRLRRGGSAHERVVGLVMAGPSFPKSTGRTGSTRWPLVPATTASMCRSRLSPWGALRRAG